MSVERKKGLFELHRGFALQRAEQGDWERFLAHASLAAHVAWENHLSIHSSLWSDPALEEALRKLGEAARPRAASPRRVGGEKLVFVASTLYDIGGHSETMRLWSKMLRDS